MSNQIELPKSQPKTLSQIIQSASQELARALPAHMNAERLVRIALTCIRLNPKLAECTQESFLGALFTAAQIGIEPIAGRAHLIPFNNKRKLPNGQWETRKEVQFVMGYPGYVELFYRHEKSVMLSWGVVKENDEFDYNYGTGAFLKHKPALKSRGETIGYYVIAKLNNGGEPFLFMSREDCLAHGLEHSKAVKDGKFYDDSPWNNDSDSMCLKTVLLQAKKLLPLSVEIQRAFEVDESSREYKQGFGDMLDMKSKTSWTKELPEPDLKKEVQAQKDNNPESDIDTFLNSDVNPEPQKTSPQKPNPTLLKEFSEFKKVLGDEKYYRWLGEFGYEHSNEIPVDKRDEVLKIIAAQIKTEKAKGK